MPLTSNYDQYQRKVYIIATIIHVKGGGERLQWCVWGGDFVFQLFTNDEQTTLEEIARDSAAASLQCFL